MADAERERWHVKAASLRDLIQTQGWDTYYADLKTLEQEATEEMVTGAPETFEYLKGKIAGLRIAMRQPEIVINAVKERYDRA